MPINSRSKGARGELELAHLLTLYTGIYCRRGQQYCGANGDADVVGLPGVHIECKREENFGLTSAFRQADRDCEGTGKIPIVIHRSNRKPWQAVMREEDYLDMKQIWEHRKDEPVPVGKHRRRKEERFVEIPLQGWCDLYSVWNQGY